MNGIYFKHFMQLFCDVAGNDHDGKIPIRCAGITDNDPPKDSIPTTLKPTEGKNPALALVSYINNSIWVQLYSGKFKTFEFDLAMEGENRKDMLKVLIELWPSDGVVKEGLSRLLISQNQIPEKTRYKIASQILKRIEDKKIGKGYFAQALAHHLSQSSEPFVIPEYIWKAVIWACGGETDGTPAND